MVLVVLRNWYLVLLKQPSSSSPITQVINVIEFLYLQEILLDLILIPVYMQSIVMFICQFR